MNNNQGFLHSHEHLIPHRNEEHVLVDKKDWLIAREHFAALQSHNSAMDAIKAVCERTDPHETDIEVLRVAVNKIYAALTMHHGAGVGRKDNEMEKTCRNCSYCDKDGWLEPCRSCFEHSLFDEKLVVIPSPNNAMPQCPHCGKPLAITAA